MKFAVDKSLITTHKESVLIHGKGNKQFENKMQFNQKLRNDRTCTFDERKPRGFFEWIDDYQKNKPQSNALAIGIMVMVCSGHQLGWGIFNSHIQAQPWAGGYEDEGTVFWAIICWFIAGIVGFAFSSIVVNNFSKISIYVSRIIQMNRAAN